MAGPRAAHPGGAPGGGDRAPGLGPGPAHPGLLGGVQGGGRTWRLPPLRLPARLGQQLAHRLAPAPARSDRPTLDDLADLAELTERAESVSEEEGGRLRRGRDGRRSADSGEAPTYEGLQLLSSVVEFGRTVTKEIMVPRPDMVTLRADQPVAEAWRVADEERYSRFPVEGRDIDDIVGVVYFARPAAGGRRTAGTPWRSASSCTRPGSCPRTRRWRRCCGRCSTRSCTWPWWSTSTAAPPGWSPWKTCSRSWSATSTTNSTRPAAAVPAARRRPGPPRRPAGRRGGQRAPRAATPRGALGHGGRAGVRHDGPGAPAGGGRRRRGPAGRGRAGGRPAHRHRVGGQPETAGGPRRRAGAERSSPGRRR